MVFIELYKPRVTHMKYIEGKKRDFLNRKRLSYFILQEIPDLFSYHKYSNMQLYIRRCFIICMCKILVQKGRSHMRPRMDFHLVLHGEYL